MIALCNDIDQRSPQIGASFAGPCRGSQLRWIREAQTDREAHELGVTESLRTGRSGGCAEDGCRVTGMGSTLVFLFY